MFKDKTVYELKTVCMLNNLEYPKNVKKTDLINIIEKAGIDYEEYEKSLGIPVDYVEAEIKTPVEVEVKEETKSEVVKDQKVLLKMIHPRGSYNAGNGIIFTLDEPFKAFPRLQADQILARTKNEIREATPEEVANFYGVSV